MKVAPAALERFCWELRRTFHDLAMAADGELAPLGIHAGDRALLEFLARESEPISLSDLARKTAVSRQYIHQSLRRLPNPAWVESLPSADDERKVLLRLSRSGRAFWKRVRAADARFFARLAPRLQSGRVSAGQCLLSDLRRELRVLSTKGERFDD